MHVSNNGNMTPFSKKANISNIENMEIPAKRVRFLIMEMFNISNIRNLSCHSLFDVVYLLILKHNILCFMCFAYYFLLVLN